MKKKKATRAEENENIDKNDEFFEFPFCGEAEEKEFLPHIEPVYSYST